MPGEDEFVMVEGVETTVVKETSSVSSSFASIGAGTIGDGEPGSGGGRGGHPDFGAPTGIVVDGSTGDVVGTATIDPQTGVAELPGVDVTVVEETSGSGESSAPTGAVAGGSATGEVTTPDSAAAAGTPEVQATGAPPPPPPAPPFWGFVRVGRHFVTRCTAVVLQVQTLQGVRTIQFRARLEARTQSPNGGPVNPHELARQADVIVSRAMAKYDEELPIALSLPPFSIVAQVHTLSDAIIAPIARQLVAAAVEREFFVVNPEASLRMHACGGG